MEVSHQIALESEIAALTNQLIEKTTEIEELEKTQGNLLLKLEDYEQTVRNLLEIRDETQKKYDKETTELKETIRIKKEENEGLQRKYKETEGCSSFQTLQILSLEKQLWSATSEYIKLEKELFKKLGPEVKPKKKEQKDQSTEYFVPMTDAPSSSSSDKFAEFYKTLICDQPADKKEKGQLEEMKERLVEVQLKHERVVYAMDARIRLLIEENEKNQAIWDNKMEEYEELIDVHDMLLKECFNRML
ncbi:hypothetical protein CRE_09325 [Caenorhabditis remanei]|uniref:Uncharacterized protein n=1 Tax=Caenorhabditis remanei TaxID=31234 RepID=E3LI58_CAERE|nr:hypothetical protein CRE_09325 [Caenorhabditis remanei]